MKIARSSIRLSPDHPSLLLDLPPEPGPFAPVVINTAGVLVDGYRRVLLQPEADLEAVRIESTNILEDALSINRRTRAWDDIDCFLWARWARSLGVAADLKVRRFAAELQQADLPLLRLLASRRLTLRQAVLILQAPLPYRPFFQSFLCQSIRLNNNETADFIHLCVDLKQILKAARIEGVLERVEGGEPDPDPRRRGEHLLKGMRILRYPYYQEKSRQFDSYWSELDLGSGIQVDRSRFLERGKLEMTLTAASRQEMIDALSRIVRSLESPLWRKIWEE